MFNRVFMFFGPYSSSFPPARRPSVAFKSAPSDEAGGLQRRVFHRRLRSTDFDLWETIGRLRLWGRRCRRFLINSSFVRVSPSRPVSAFRFATVHNAAAAENRKTESSLRFALDRKLPP